MGSTWGRQNPDEPHVGHTNLAIRVITADEIKKIMGQFIDSASGWDSLKPSIMKNIKENVNYLLAHICNLVISLSRLLYFQKSCIQSKWLNDIYKLQTCVSTSRVLKVGGEIGVR